MYIVCSMIVCYFEHSSNCQVSNFVYQMRALQPSSESLHRILNNHRSHSFCFPLWNILGMSHYLSTLWTVGNTKRVWEKVYRTYEAKVSKPNTRFLKNTTVYLKIFKLTFSYFACSFPPLLLITADSPMPDSSWS